MLTPVTNPEVLTVATEVLEEVHALVVAGVALPVNCLVEPIQTFNIPVIVGSAFTVKVILR